MVIFGTHIGELLLAIFDLFGFGRHAHWNGLERSYREDLAKVNEENKRNEGAKKRRKYGNASAKWGTLAVSRV